MKHGKKNRTFGRETKQRKELLRGLAESIVLNGKITTTQAKAKSLKVYIEKAITQGKNKNLASIRVLTSRIGKSAAKKLVDEIGPRLASRNGGYTRVINLPRRVSDGARMAQIEIL